MVATMMGVYRVSKRAVAELMGGVCQNFCVT
jgi:hypothetical protein